MSTDIIKKPAVRKTVVKKTAVAAKKTTAVKKIVKLADGIEISTASEKAVAVAKTEKYVFATGRRKTSVANVKIYDTEGALTINKKPAKQYFSAPFLLDTAVQGFKLTGRGGSLKAYVNVRGGGPNSQAVAVRHALSRALLIMDVDLRPVLKKNGLLTRDSREKERKKPGLRRARRAPQWAKR